MARWLDYLEQKKKHCVCPIKPDVILTQLCYSYLLFSFKLSGCDRNWLMLARHNIAANFCLRQLAHHQKKKKSESERTARISGTQFSQFSRKFLPLDREL